MNATLDDPIPEIDDCWNRIGVQGDRSCPELQKFVLCRNCPVHTRAARVLLERGMAPESRREWMKRIEEQKQPKPLKRASAVLFRIQEEWFALPTELFQEVAEKRLIHSLPHRRGGILLGLGNIRGELLLCVSLGRLLGLEPVLESGARSRPQSRSLVVNRNGRRFIFPVDEVPGLHRLAPISPTLSPSLGERERYTQSIFQWQERRVALLDPERLFAAVERSLP